MYQFRLRWPDDEELVPTPLSMKTRAYYLRINQPEKGLTGATDLGFFQQGFYYKIGINLRYHRVRGRVSTTPATF